MLDISTQKQDAGESPAAVGFEREGPNLVTLEAPGENGLIPSQFQIWQTNGGTAMRTFTNFKKPIYIQPDESSLKPKEVLNNSAMTTQRGVQYSMQRVKESASVQDKLPKI